MIAAEAFTQSIKIKKKAVKKSPSIKKPKKLKGA
jgi:hypothetical protein